MKIFLIGMPGSGKTTVGKALAQKLNLPFVDLDEEIVAAQRQSIPDIFKTKGEASFRRMEAEILRTWATGDKTFVMATGGGAPCFFDSMKMINGTGVSVYLRVPMAELVRRVLGKTDRPLLAANDAEEVEQRLKDLLMQRELFYKQAKFVSDDGDVSAIAKMLMPKN